MVPLWLTIGGHQYRDGELALRDVVAGLAHGISTSGPAPGEVAQALERADQGQGVAVLTVSARMSGANQAAHVAAGLARARGQLVEVVDTGTAAGAQGLVVRASAALARSGAGLAEVAAHARALSAQTRLVATVPSLDHLARSGRVPGAAAWGARWAGLAPLFEFAHGQARPLRPALGTSQALRRIAEMVVQDGAKPAHRGASLHIAALHALEPERAEQMLALVRRNVQPASVFVAAFSPAMVAHTGPGVAGLAWRWEAGPTG